jgi:glycerol-3-phosphate dehydrogenase
MAAVQMSQIIVPKLFESDNVYVFQNDDGRLIFAAPFEREFTLIGAVAHDFTGDPAIVAMPGADVSYLCEAVSRYFRERVAPTDVVRTVSGVNLSPASARHGDGTTLFHARRRKAPMLTMFGGDVTTSRLRAERAVTRLTPFYPMSRPWTASAALPGGDFSWDRFETEVDLARHRWGFLSEPQARRMVAAYGSRLPAVLGEAKTRDELGPAFGPDLTGTEVRYLMAREWARFPEDILWRRSKLGLTMPAADRAALAAFMADPPRTG